MMRTTGIILASMFGLLGLAGLVIWSGIYNVSAAVPEHPVVRWILSTARDQSIAAHSEDQIAPPLDDPRRIQSGSRTYHQMCRACHSAPGEKPTEIGKGLDPQPPRLDAPRTQTRRDADIFWIVQNGISMTGMPAIGKTHSEDELWALVAFIRRLPNLTPEQYDAMVEEAGLSEESLGHH